MSTDVIPALDTKIGGVWNGISTKLAERIQEIYGVPQTEEDKNSTPLPDNCEVRASNNIDILANNSGLLNNVTEHVIDIISNDLDKGQIPTEFGNFKFERTQDGGVDIYTPDGKCGARFTNQSRYRSQLMEIVNIDPISLWDAIQ